MDDRATLVSALAGFVLLSAAPSTSCQSAPPVIRRESYVTVKSTAPAMQGSNARIYLREVVEIDAAAPTRGVVLFVHGAGTPGEVAFDVPHGDYSWMEFLARAGYDTFVMDMTGYGRSTRPPAMDDPCNLPKAQQAQFVPSRIAQPCAASFPRAMTTMGSDWDDIGAVVDHLRATRNVDKVSIIGWSQGGPRAGGYAAQHPEKVDRLIVLAPAYSRAGALGAPHDLSMKDGPMNVQTQHDFIANWDRQVGCASQYDSAVATAIWSDMLASDPTGARWGIGVRRAPQVPTWGFNHDVVAKMTTPFLMISGAHDKQVAPEHVRELYDDLGSTEKVFVDLACSSHNAMWEKNHLLLFQASLDWLGNGKIDGLTHGIVRRGY